MSLEKKRMKCIRCRKQSAAALCWHCEEKIDCTQPRKPFCHTCRVEIKPADAPTILRQRNELYEALKDLAFGYDINSMKKAKSILVKLDAEN